MGGLLSALLSVWTLSATSLSPKEIKFTGFTESWDMVGFQLSDPVPRLAIATVLPKGVFSDIWDSTHTKSFVN